YAARVGGQPRADRSHYGCPSVAAHKIKTDVLVDQPQQMVFRNLRTPPYLMALQTADQLHLFASFTRKSTSLYRQFADVSAFVIRKCHILANRALPHMSFSNGAPLVVHISPLGVAE